MPYVKLDMGRFIEGLPQEEGYFDALSHSKEAFNDSLESDDWVEKLNEFLVYLTRGKLPVGVKCKSPKVSLDMAGNIIWFLSEVLKIIPDTYEICDICEDIYNSDMMSYYETNGKHYCSSCEDDAPVCHCEDCGDEAGYKDKAYSEKDGLYLCKHCRKERRNKEKK
jgi:hypothetical protein